MTFRMQRDGTLLATGSYDGCARIWTTTGIFPGSVRLKRMAHL